MIFRVQFRKDGAVATCAEVESSVKDGERVFYVDAINKTEAIKKARALWVGLDKKRQAAIKSGVCRYCRKEPVINKNMCAMCQAKSNDSQRELKRLRSLPPDIAAPLLKARAAAITERRRAKFAQAIEMGRVARYANMDRQWDDESYVPPAYASAILRQCLRAYDRDPAQFRSWILGKLSMSDRATAAE